MPAQRAACLDASPYIAEIDRAPDCVGRADRPVVRELCPRSERPGLARDQRVHQVERQNALLLPGDDGEGEPGVHGRRVRSEFRLLSSAVQESEALWRLPPG